MSIAYDVIFAFFIIANAYIIKEKCYENFLTVRNYGLTILSGKEGKIDEKIIDNCFKFIACF